MIRFEKARRLIEKNIPAFTEEYIPLAEALGRVSARSVKSPVSLPIFDNSAVDGFVLRSADTENASAQTPVRLTIHGELKAGDSARIPLRQASTCRIMTGAPIPPGADTVLMKEHALLKDNCLFFDAPLPKGKNIRVRGEELKKGKVALRKGTVINPGSIGFLASVGIDRLRVYRVPRVSVIATGSELVGLGAVLKRGKIYDSNLPMVSAALDAMRVRPVFTRRLPDQRKVIRQILSFALRDSDILILMGGVSVGDHDFVKELLAELGVETVFWKVSQKPGKPLYFGKKNKTLVFGLPGNPAAVFTCFYEYVYPAIRSWMGYQQPYLSSMQLKPEKILQPDKDKTLFMKAKMGNDDSVRVLQHQNSHMLSSLCEADSFVVLSPASAEIPGERELAVVHALPYSGIGL